jgi:hypothetical protein
MGVWGKGRSLERFLSGPLPRPRHTAAPGARIALRIAVDQRYAVRSDAVAQPVGLAVNVHVSSTGYKSRPSGRLGTEFVSFFCNAWRRSLRASLSFRSQWSALYLH